jgi:hypothetical protein
VSQEQTQHVSNAGQDDTVTAVGSSGAAEHQGEEEEHIHLPGPSYWPILLASAMGLTMVGLMIDVSVAAVGLLLAFMFGIGWSMNWGLESHQAHVE